MNTDIARTSAPRSYPLRGIYAAQRSGTLLNIALYGLALLVILIGAYLIGQGQSGFYVLGAVVALIIGVVVMVRPAIGIYALVVFVYLNLSDNLQVYFNIPSINKPIVGLIFVAVLANRVVLHRQPLMIHRVVGAILAYGIVLLFSALIAADQNASFSYITDWFKDFAVLLIILQLCNDENAWKNAQWLLIFSAAFIGLLSCYQIVSGRFDNQFFGLANTSINQITNTFDSTRVSGPLSDPNYYAQIILMILPLAVYRALTETRPPVRLIAAACAAIIFMTVVFTYSRAAFVALFILLLLIALERKFNLYKIAFGVIVVILIAIPLLPPGYLDRILTLQELITNSDGTQVDLSFQGRASEALVAVNMFLDHPILGIGIANYEDNYLLYSDQLGMDPRLEDREAHSLYLEVLAETGLVGEVAFLVVIVGVFLALKRAKAQLTAAKRLDLVPWVTSVQFSLLSFLLTSIFLHGAYSRYMWLIIAIGVGGAIVAQRITDRARAADSPFDALFSTEIQPQLSVLKNE